MIFGNITKEYYLFMILISLVLIIVNIWDFLIKKENYIQNGTILTLQKIYSNLYQMITQIKDVTGKKIFYIAVNWFLPLKESGTLPKKYLELNYQQFTNTLRE